MATQSTTEIFSLRGQGLKCDDAPAVEHHIEGLVRSDKIKHVVLGGNTFGVEACQRIGEVLATKQDLARLDLDDIFTGRLISEIPPALTHLLSPLLSAPNPLSNLTVLDLSDNAFGGRSVDPLVPFLSSHLPLEELILANNGLGPQGGTVIADALTELGKKARAQGDGESRLKQVICGRNRLENGSSEAWGRAFSTHGSLREVRLYQNGIRMEGFQNIMKGLRSCPSLQVLDMADNTATLKGSRAVAKSMPFWRNLQELNLNDCLLKPTGAALVLRKYQEGSNKKLEIIKLQSNEINDRGYEILIEGLEKWGEKIALLDLNGNKGDLEEGEAKEGIWARIVTALDKWGNSQALQEIDELEEDDGEEEEDDEEEEEEEPAPPPAVSAAVESPRKAKEVFEPAKPETKPEAPSEPATKPEDKEKDKDDKDAGLLTKMMEKVGIK